MKMILILKSEVIKLKY